MIDTSVCLIMKHSLKILHRRISVLRRTEIIFSHLTKIIIKRFIEHITGSRSWLYTFNLKQTVQTIMHRFYELHQAFSWNKKSVYCLYITESTVWCNVAWCTVHCNCKWTIPSFCIFTSCEAVHTRRSCKTKDFHKSLILLHQ